MALKRTLYEILGVGRKATVEEVAAAWQKVSAGHPDQASLALAREARRILSDPAQRAAYDASLVASAARALASDGTGKRRREEADEKQASRTPLIAAVVLGVAVAAGFGLWQARKPAPGAGGIVSREVIELKDVPGAPAPERPIAAQAATAPSAPAVTVGSVADLRTGQKVYAIGAPQGLELSLSDGLVSSLRDIPGGTVIQTTAPISPGSSGGGLFDASGRLVGIMTFQHRYGQNLNFAVPADWIAEMRARDGSARAATAVAGPQAQAGASILGRWSCFGSSTGQSGEWVFGENGAFSITRSGSSPTRGRYELRGRTLQIGGGGDAFRLEVESLSGDRMVLNGGGGNRVACERRG